MNEGHTGADPGQPLHDRLNAARQQKGLSIREAARLIGVPTPTLQGWLNGRHQPTPALRPQFLRLVELLGISDESGETWARRQRAIRLREPRPPYLGLRPFSQTDADLFQGRDHVLRDLAARIAPLRCGLVAVIGASGSGKSSLLAAGLVGTQCNRGGALAGWTARLLQATRLAEADGAGSESLQEVRLLVVDQFEDVLRLPSDQRDQVLDRVTAEASQRVVVIALRSDAFGEAMDIPGLGHALSEPFLLGPPSEEELRQAIVAPAATTGVSVDADLVEVILRDLAPTSAVGQLAPLPLLSNALLATWALGDGQRMTVADYLRAGGIASGIERLADAAYAELAPDDQAAVQNLFLRMVRVEPDDVHRELIPLAASDIERTRLDGFVSARLVTSDADGLWISHDALLSYWPRLGDWIDASRQELQAVAQLRRAARLWVDSDRDPAALISVQRLPVFARFADEGGHLLLSPLEQEFLDASTVHFANQLEAERTTSGRLRRRGRMAIALAAVAVVLAVIAGFMFGQARQSASLAQAAEREAKSRQVASEADQMRDQDPAMAVQFGLLAHTLAPTREGRSALLDATSLRAPTRWTGAGPAVMATSSDGSLVVRGGGDGELTVWRAPDLAATPGLTVSVDPARQSVAAVAACVVGGRHLAAVGGTGLLQLWDVTGTPARLATLPSGSDAVWSAAAFSTDGALLAAGDQTGEIRLYDLATAGSPNLLRTLTQPSTDGGHAAVSALAFSRDSRTLYVAGMEARVLRWRTDTFRPLEPITFACDRPAISLAVSPSGDRLVAGLYGRRALQWRLDGTSVALERELTGFLGEVPGVAFSADGRSVLAASEDHGMYRFDSGDGRLIETLKGPSPLISVAEVDGRVVTTSAVGDLRVWPRGDPLLRTGGSTGYVFSTDRASRWLALSTAFDGIALWEQADGYRRLPDPTADLGELVNGQAPGFASGVALDPEGRYLLGGTTDGRVVSWALRGTGTGAPRITSVLPGQYVGGLAISPDRRLVAAVAMNNGTATALLRANNDGTLTPLGLLASPDPYSASFSADSQLVAIPIGSNAVQIWSVADPAKPQLVSTLDDLPAKPMIATFAPTCRRLAVGMENGQLWVWDLSDERAPRIALERGDARGEIYGVNWSPDEQTIIAAGGDENVWAWSTADGTTTTTLALRADSGRTNDAIFTNSGSQIAVTGANGRVRVWTATPEDATRQLCGSRGDPLSAEEWARFLPGVEPVDPC